jgi:hypothetical protein
MLRRVTVEFAELSDIDICNPDAPSAIPPSVCDEVVRLVCGTVLRALEQWTPWHNP